MKEVDGWFCPNVLTGPGSYMNRWKKLHQALVDHGLLPTEQQKKLPVAIQAGGHIGVWPVMLSGLFETVYTFEPEWENFKSLVRNLEESKGVFPIRALLGSTDSGGRDLFVNPKNTGQHRVLRGKSGVYPMFAIDQLGVRNCSALFLDTEGCELAALTGAHSTIDAFHPFIVAEENKRCVEQGHNLGQMDNYLRAIHGYKLLFTHEEDRIYVKG